MKKIVYAMSVFIAAINIASAKPVTPTSAQTVAENFYKQNSKTVVSSVSLAYTEVSTDGSPVFYVFNINSTDGFVMVSAEDAVKPVLGYSTKNSFVTPKASTSIGYWLKYRANEITTIRAMGLTADAKTTNEWAKYNGTSTSRLSGNNNSVATTATVIVAPLVQTTWNQSPFYNDSCPGGSVTGCVATAMAQIMKYWSYPPKGTGSSSYTESQSSGDYENYGLLSANYGATTYNWAGMPLNVTSSNAAVAQLMKQCGVSVDMDYSPNESGAFVLSVENPVCAQNSYVTYFGYDPNQIQGTLRSSQSTYNDSVWIALIENDLNIGRPVQYEGSDPTQGGHTWVCDGYDSNNYLHMNWGWGGDDNGFFSINNLQTTNGGFNPSQDHGVLTGIVPLTTTNYDAGVSSVLSPSGSYCGSAITNDSLSVTVKLQNFGNVQLFGCNVNYELDNSGVIQTIAWSGSLVQYQPINVVFPNILATSGTHTLVAWSDTPDGGVDENDANDTTTVIFTVTNKGVLPVVEGFESSTCPSGVLPNANWNVFHTSTTGGVDFAITNSAAATGSQSCMLNNMSNSVGNNSIIQTFNSYDMTTFTTPSLTFKAAYQQTATTNTDKLQIFTSTDCGATWISRKVITSATLAALAGGTGTSAYVPTPAQFTTYSVPMSAVASSTNVMFRWEFLAGTTSLGNNLYIDDINIVDATSGIESFETSVGLNIYPNPSAGKVSIDFNLSEQNNVSVTVTDMLGRTVETIPSKFYQSGETTLIIGANNTYQSGVYLVNITINGQHISKKVIIQ